MLQHYEVPSSESDLIRALGRLNNENRIITTPWSRIVRGLGMGQYPVPFCETLSGWIQDAFDELKAKTESQNNYTHFSSLLCDFICLLIQPGKALKPRDRLDYISNILFLINNEADPYRRIMQYTITIDALAKLNINLFDVLEKSVDLPGLLFNTVQQIKSDGIQDENSGKHGDYEKLSAYTSVFFALASCGKAHLAITRRQNHVENALGLLNNIPSPFFRGRGGSMLFSAISVLGLQPVLKEALSDAVLHTLDYLDRADAIGINPSFPQPMSAAFVKVYPLLTMLNAIAVTGERRALNFRQDRLRQARDLLEALTPVEQTHMGLYYIMAVYNLGLIEQEQYDVDALVETLAETAMNIDPSENYFLHGIACSYVLETALITGRKDLITDRLTSRLAESFATMDKCVEDEINRPYPFAYALTMLGEAGLARKMFEPSPRYGNQSAASWTIANLTQVKDGADGRLYMLNHALINLMLRMRGQDRSAEKAYGNVVF